MFTLGKNDLKGLCGVSVEDNGDLHNLQDIIEELQGFLGNFSTHSMNETALFYQGQRQAYENVVDYLKRVAGTEDDCQ